VAYDHAWLKWTPFKFFAARLVPLVISPDELEVVVLFDARPEA
jgi:hypothetical protein